MGEPLYNRYGRKVGELNDSSNGWYLILIPIFLVALIISSIGNSLKQASHPYIEIVFLAKDASLSGNATLGSCLGDEKGSYQLKAQSCVLLSPGGEVTSHITIPRQDLIPL